MLNASPSPDNPNESLDQTIASLNEAAGKIVSKTARQKSSRKRKPINMSRLQRKTSTQSRHHYNRHNLYEQPEDEAPSQPQKLVRKLAKRPADPSPLKGQGIVNMPTSGVDLDDSPKRSKKAKTTSNFVLAVQTRAMSHNHTQKEISPEHDNGHLPETDRAGSPDSVAASEQNDTTKDQEHIRAGGGDKGVKSPKPRNDKSRTASPVAQPKQVVSQAQTQETARVQKEVPLRDKEDIITELIQPIATIANVHDCQDYWEKILYNAHLVFKGKETQKPKSDKGKRVYRRVEHLKREYGYLKHAQYDGDDPGSPSNLIEVLKQRLQNFDGDEQDDKQGGEKGQKAQDLIQIIVPELVFLLRGAVEARSLLGNPDFTVWKELLALMRLTAQAAEMAYRRKPQAHDLSNDIRSCVYFIQKDLERLVRRTGEEVYRHEQARLSLADQQRLLEEAHNRREKLLSRQNQARARGGTTGVRASTGQSASQDSALPAYSQAPRTPIDLDDLDDLDDEFELRP